jgi:transposase InsO family protein
MQNAFVESFNGRLRDDFLNETLFTSLTQAHLALEDWRRAYNNVRPIRGSAGWRQRPRCLVPECGGISQTDPSFREALWDRYSTAAPRPRTLSELQYSDRRLRSKN